MKILKWLFSKNEVKKIDEPKDKFVIEHYPLSGFYTVKYKNGWLKTGYRTGVVRIDTLFDVVDLYKSEEEAKESIARFKEQKLKVLVTYTDVE